ncbi:AraC family transcriptional regulator [Azospirillum isscasi]|uniref:Helix-turn-helix transcriptional regulator n=1 Tax=Azospirillum isscasi TaxID=3053926 RepID=A0ABU0WEV3_9PROT|nr:helix-turn-helix transcriptional regulator [Azospirillum isscasi]MDQ2102747.1 helix-turn-helix transcriptional regulator [Azospirillum isscasi]
MTPFPFPPNPGLRPHRVWDYWRPAGSGIVELGTVRGLDVALPVHFHREDQLTFVLAGRRRFVIGDERCEAASGQGVHIPAGTPHRSLCEPSEVVCINIYAPPGAYAAGDMMSGLARHWRRTGGMGWADLALIAEDHRLSIGSGAGPAVAEPAVGGEPWETVGAAARRAGMSREGFSRRFRRCHGVPPHAFRLLERLNDARRLLRAGEPIAAVAADTGFADQSHLGRCFRRAFGVTPGRYRTG